MTALDLIRSRRLWMLLIVAGAIALPLSMTQPTTADDDSPLEKAMETINSHYKMLRREARKGEYGEDTVQRLKEMQHAAIESMHEVPAILKKIPAGEQKQFMIDYRKANMEMAIHFMKMDIAYAEGKLEEFGKMIDEMGDLKSVNHEKFVEDE